MTDRDLWIIGADDVQQLLEGREQELIEIVRRAYLAHAVGDSALPHSIFLRFPDSEGNRIIGLPAFLGGEFAAAGIKWVSSFPSNVDYGRERATAAVILNSVSSGRPETVLEGSQISAKRTAASAALAALALAPVKTVAETGLIGCGVINFEIARFLRAAFPGLNHLTVFDLDFDRATRFADKLNAERGEMEVKVCRSAEAVLESAPVVAIATTAIRPHIYDLSMCQPGATLLHVSLRDIAPEALLGCYNLADDIDHVCRAQTSVHLTEQLVGNRDFVKGTLADVLLNKAAVSRPPDAITVFNPFGLGILDLALSVRVAELARQGGLGTVIPDFLPASWGGAQTSRMA